MPVRLNDLLNETRQVTVEYLGETVTVEYLVNVVTPQFVSDAGNVAAQVAKVVKNWDIVDEKGKPLAPADIVERLPIALLSRILETVTADMRAVLSEKKE
ncbi:MAG: hypothetical protein WHV44_00225 [Anaerolineales bacterium]